MFHINCENLTAYYEAKTNENEENIQWFETALDILSARCSDKPIFLSMAQKFYDLNKNAKSAGFLAMASVKNRKTDDAKKYFEEAAILENDSIEKVMAFKIEKKDKIKAESLVTSRTPIIIVKRD